jgi:hypothetical protein
VTEIITNLIEVLNNLNEQRGSTDMLAASYASANNDVFVGTLRTMESLAE